MGTSQVETLESDLDRLLAELQWSRRRFARMLFEDEWDELIDPVPGEKDQEFERFYSTYRKRVARRSRNPEAVEREIRSVFRFADELGIKLDYVIREPLSLGILEEELEQGLRSIFEDIEVGK